MLSKNQKVWIGIVAVVIVVLIIMLSLFLLFIKGGEEGEEALPTGIQSVQPAGGAVNVAINTNVMIVFKQAMNQTPTENAFSLKTGTSNGMVGFFSWSIDNKTMTFDPNDELSYATLYIATLSKTAKDENENAILTTDFSWSFTTESAPPSLQQISAKERYSQVETRAHEWHSDAYLVAAMGTEDGSSPSGQNGDGKLYIWTYNYYSPSAQKGAVITISADGIITGPIEGLVDTPPPEVINWYIDSTTAVNTANAAGGSAYLTAHPSAVAMYTLCYDDVTYLAPLWTITYDTMGFMAVIDANTGDLLVKYP